MSLFVFIAGVVYKFGLDKGKYYNSLSFIRKKTQRLMIPYLFWGLVQSFLFSEYVEFIPFKSFLPNSSFLHLWFLEMLFVVFVIALITKKIWDSENKKIVILFSGIALFILMLLRWVPNYCNLRNALLYYPVFLLGIYTVKYDLAKRINKRCCSLLLCITTLGAVQLTLKPYTPYTWILSILFSGSLVLLFYKGVLVCVQKFPAPSFIGKVDNNSMGIYIIHHILIWCSIIYLPGFERFAISHNILVPVVLCLASFFCALLLTMVFRKNKYSLVSGENFSDKVLTV